MKKREVVSQIMTSHVLTIDLKDALIKAETTMKRHNIRHIPVVDNRVLVGMLSLTDLLRLSFVDTYGDDEDVVDNAMYDMLSIEQIMVQNPVSVEVDTTIHKVAEILANNEFHALPVTKEGKIAGIVTTTDLIRYLLDQY